MIRALTRKELKTNFDHPTAYLLLVVFLVINAFFFFRSSFLVNVASLRPMFEPIIYLFLFLIPALTMRQFAEEKRHSTLESLFAQPLRPWQILAGKFLGSSLFILFALGLTLGIPLFLSSYGEFDWGAIVAQYLGSVLLAFSMIALGLFASSVTKNQVTAFLIAVALNFIFVLLGFEVVLSSIPFQVKAVVEQLSLTWHYQNIARGVLDLRDIIFFLTFTGTFLFLTVWCLIADRVKPKRPKWRRLKMSVGLVALASVIVNLLGLSIHGRLDLTENKVYTLSRSTTQIVQNLSDPLTLSLYHSQELPPEISTVVRDVEDLLADLETSSNGKVKLEKKPIGASGLQEAQAQGIQPVQFNVVKSDEFQLKQGVFGLTLTQGEKKEVIPFIEQTEDFELQLLSLIRKMTVTTKPKIGFLTGHGEKSYYSDYAGFVRALEDRYEVTSTSFNIEQKGFDPAVDLIVVAGPTEEISEQEQQALQTFLEADGKIFALIDPVTVEVNTLSASVNAHSFANFTKANGVDVQPLLIGDVASSESVTFGGGQFSFVLPYPFWLRAQAGGGHLIQQGAASVVFAWASPLELSQTSENLEVLYATSPQIFTQQETFTLNPDQDYSSYPLKGERMPVAAALTIPSEGEKKGGRMVVVGDSDFLTENFTQEGSANLIFALNSLDWLSADELLISVRSKQRQVRGLVFDRPSQKSLVRNLNVIGVPLLVVVAGGAHLWRRKRKTQATTT